MLLHAPVENNTNSFFYFVFFLTFLLHLFSLFSSDSFFSFVTFFLRIPIQLFYCQFLLKKQKEIKKQKIEVRRKIVTSASQHDVVRSMRRCTVRMLYCIQLYYYMFYHMFYAIWCIILYTFINIYIYIYIKYVILSSVFYI